MRSAFVVGCGAVIVVACSSTNTGGTSAPPPPCVVDATEPNETFLTKTNLGTIHDDDIVGTKPEASPTKIDKYFSIHTATDVDWYEVDVGDTGIGGNPQIEVMIDKGFAATALWACTAGKTTAVVCGVGTKVDHDPDIADAQGCELVQPPSSGTSPQTSIMVECDGSDDSGRLFLRVKSLAPADTCQGYRLSVTAQ